jgi:polyisoprenoid-binding protein YceI
MKRTLVAAGVLALVLVAAPARADDYTIDADHTSVVFKISHVGISWTYGRFNDVSGQFTFDRANPAGSSFALNIKAASIDTGNGKRDEHLRSPDFFNVKQYPAIGFKSTSVKAVDGGWQVAGDFTLHGVTKPITFTLAGGKETEFPKGTKRIGFSTELQLKRTDFGMDRLVGPVGDEVFIAVSFEGVKK